MMELNYIGPSKVTDTDYDLLEMVVMIPKYTDPQCSILMSKEDSRVLVHALPSLPEFKQEMVDNLLFINKNKNAKVIFSKSLERSRRVSFELMSK